MRPIFYIASFFVCLCQRTAGNNSRPNGSSKEIALAMPMGVHIHHYKMSAHNFKQIPKFTKFDINERTSNIFEIFVKFYASTETIIFAAFAVLPNFFYILFETS